MTNKQKPATAKFERGLTSADLKVRLIAVSRVILEQEGVEALTLRAAARAAGVSHMAPYRHFEDKDHLLAAVAVEGFLALAEALQRGAERAPDAIPPRTANGIAYIKFARANPALYRLMFGSNLVPRDRFPALAESGRQAYQGCLMAAGDEPEKAITLWAVVHGLALLLLDGLVIMPDREPGFTRELAAILAHLE